MKRAAERLTKVGRGSAKNGTCVDAEDRYEVTSNRYQRDSLESAVLKVAYHHSDLSSLGGLGNEVEVPKEGIRR